MSPDYILGIDIGGTFTDFVLSHTGTGEIWLAKYLTTPEEPARAVRDGLAHLTTSAGITGADLAVVIHGTTLITNALIERKGARTALVTTDGHRDVLEIGSELRYDTYDLKIELPEPLIARPQRYEVPERLLPSGEVLTPLDEAAVRQVAKALAESDIQAVGVCFLHSFANPSHERRTREILAEALPGAAISISSEVAPEIREYQRMSTTVANAYVQPIAGSYVRRLHADLASAGYARPLYMMLSSGGIVTHETAARFPIRLIESGPAAGALATVTLGDRIGRKDLIAFDMGGTTAKATIVENGALTTSKEFEVARVRRFQKGSGLPLQVPVIEMIEIGAGGGSIAHLGDMGLLKVGPESAGADPGPACYGRGGDQPTVTDADLLLGYLDPNFFLGGTMSLDVGAARSAMDRLARRLSVEPDRLVRGVFEVVNNNMIAAAKVHLSEKGRDARRYALVAFGGMGPMHAHAVARGLKLREVVCPASAGVLSAWGMLVAPTSFEFGRSLVGRLDENTLAAAEALFAEMEEEGRRLLIEAGVAQDRISFQRSADMRYRGQNRELTVPLPGRLEGDAASGLQQLFYNSYRNVYGHAHTDVEVQLMTCRLVASSPHRRVPNRAATSGTGEARKGTREAWFDAADAYLQTPVYDRYHLTAGTELDGPAIFEERESTAVVPPGARVHVDEELNLVIDLGSQG